MNDTTLASDNPLNKNTKKLIMKIDGKITDENCNMALTGK